MEKVKNKKKEKVKPKQMEGARSSAHQPLLRQKQPKPGPQWSASSRQGSHKLYKYRNAQIHTYANTLLHRYTYKQQIQKNALSPVVGKCIHYVIQPRVLEFVIFLLEWKNRFNSQEKANYNSVVQQQAEPI